MTMKEKKTKYTLAGVARNTRYPDDIRDEAKRLLSEKSKKEYGMLKRLRHGSRAAERRNFLEGVQTGDEDAGFSSNERLINLSEQLDNYIEFDRQRDALRRHSVHHTDAHIQEMKRLMMEGKTFSEAHKIAMRKVGR